MTSDVGLGSAQRIMDITLEGVSAGYGRSVVLRDLSLSVEAGSSLGIVGPNGAGKSTLLATMAGLITPMKGSVSSSGRDIAGLRPEERRRRGLALVAEGRRVFPSLTVNESMMLACRTLGATRRDVAVGIARAFDRFPALEVRRHVTGALLSGGEQQMLCLAMALAGEPSVLLIDEPFMGLAPVVTTALIEELRALERTGVTLVIADESRMTLERLGLQTILSISTMGSQPSSVS